MQFGPLSLFSGLWRAIAVCLLALATAFVSPMLQAQSITSGDITGTVTDPSGAVLSNAAVTMKNAETGASRTTAANGAGVYRFSLVPLGNYTLTISASGFQTASKVVTVAVGQTLTVDVQLSVASSATSVEVSEAIATVQTENADLTTTFTSTQIADLPNPGNDMSAIAYTTPGITMSTQSGYGNFSAFGMGGTANLFTINGMNDNDPFLNLNNSGATNLLLGTNEVAEEAVVLNGYSGQYGQLPGANVNIVTKSGANQFHGNLIWYWNGRAMNANDFLNNASGTPRPFDNANQWAGSIGGPVWKNHTFFFFDTEGLRVLLPNSADVYVPTPAFQSAILTNLQATNPDAVPFYQNMFKLYNGAPGASGAVPQPGTCGDIPGNLPGLDTALGDACSGLYRQNASNLTHEALYAGRVDQILGQNDRAYVRLQRDSGVQATYTDFINPSFNADSYQPEMQGQIGETHIFGPNAVNQFVLGGQYYKAVFSPSGGVAPQRALTPVTINFYDGSSITPLGGIDFYWPQGRNVTEYQVVDDFSLTKGNHTIKAGMNYHRNDVTDLDYGEFTNPLVFILSTTDFYNGGPNSYLYDQAFPSANEQPMALYMLGLYVEDDWKVTKSLKVNLSLRADHNSNPVCQDNCFALSSASFLNLSHDANTPYNQAINAGVHQAYPATTNIVWEPRVGFAWSPLGSGKTVIRGGGGIFLYSFPAQVVDGFSENPPMENSFSLVGGLVPGLAGSVYSIASAANQSLLSAFKSGGTLASIEASNPYFVPPNLSSSDATIVQPRVYEWNLEVQQALPWNMLLSVNYAGNHGIYLPIQNNGVNGYCPPSQCPNGFAGLPSAPVDSRFVTVNQIQSNGVSRYNGLTASILRRFSNGFQFQLGYTWSHALDDVSNGGFDPFNDKTTVSFTNPEDPYNVRLYNYGSSDYDVRHEFTGSYVWDNALRHMFHWGPNAVFGGWVVAGTINYRTGLPFTVVDGGTSGALGADGVGGPTFAWVTGSGPTSCGKSATLSAGCFAGGQFAPSASDLSFSGFSNQGRNEFRGPGYFDTDMDITKFFAIRESMKLGLGVQFFNLFNHPNFDTPVNDVSQSNFGQIINTVGPATSILGAFLGGDASPRIIQVKLQFDF